MNMKSDRARERIVWLKETTRMSDAAICMFWVSVASLGWLGGHGPPHIRATSPLYACMHENWKSEKTLACIIHSRAYTKAELQWKTTYFSSLKASFLFMINYDTYFDIMKKKVRKRERIKTLLFSLVRLFHVSREKFFLTRRRQLFQRRSFTFTSSTLVW